MDRVDEEEEQQEKAEEGRKTHFFKMSETFFRNNHLDTTTNTTNRASLTNLSPARGVRRTSLRPDLTLPRNNSSSSNLVRRDSVAEGGYIIQDPESSAQFDIYPSAPSPRPYRSNTVDRRSRTSSFSICDYSGKSTTANVYDPNYFEGSPEQVVEVNNNKLTVQTESDIDDLDRASTRDRSASRVVIDQVLSIFTQKSPTSTTPTATINKTLK